MAKDGDVPKVGTSSAAATDAADLSFASGANAAYVQNLYARFAANPNSVSADWRTYFESLDDGAGLDAAKAAGRSRFEVVEQRFDALREELGGRMDAHTARMDVMNDRIDGLRAEMQETRAEIGERRRAELGPHRLAAA